MAGLYNTDDISTKALIIANNACGDLNKIITDVQDKILDTPPVGYERYQGVDITSAAGAMAIDKIIQDLTTSVQVAAQILAALKKAREIVVRTLGS
jgi:hypothetical protein